MCKAIQNQKIYVMLWQHMLKKLFNNENHNKGSS